MERVVVAGAGFGGLNTALILARSSNHEVILVDKRKEQVYTPGLIDILTDRRSVDNQKISLESVTKGTGIKLRQEEISRFVPEDQVVETGKGRIDYDKLVVGLGSSVSRPIEIGGAESFYTLEQAASLKKKVEPGSRVVMIGSGYVGLEVAGELHELGCDIQIYEMDSRPLPRMSEQISLEALDYLNGAGINFTGGKKAVKIDSQSVRFDDGTHDLGDVVIWNGGIQADEIVQRDFGCGKAGIPVNSSLESMDHRNVYALGDNADIDVEKTAHNAMRQAKTVADSVKGGKTAYDEGVRMLAISLGKTGIMVLGDRSIKSRPVRYLKDGVRAYYKATVKARHLLARLN